MIAIAVVDDDPSVRHGLPEQIHRISGEFAVIGAFASVQEFLDDSRAVETDVVLLDVLRCGGDNRLDSDLSTLKQLDANVAIITVDTRAAEIIPVLRRHQVSIVDKNDIIDDAMLRWVITQVARGARIVDSAVQAQLNDDLPMPKLTPRQDDVLREADRGSPVRRIAEALHITVDVVRTHLEEIERRFADAGYPIRKDGEEIRDRAYRLSQKAKEIGYFTRKPNP